MQDQFKQTYFEECEDRILESEEGLTLLMDSQQDDDTVDQVFRAIHSIKGGAGAFGFDEIVDFTHHFETVLDFIRQDRLSPDRDMCTLFLRANDILSDMLAERQNDNQLDRSVWQDVFEKLEQISRTVQGGATGSDEAEAQNQTSQQDLNSEEKTWAILFRPSEDLLKSGNDPLFIIQALKDLGHLDVTAETDNLPALSDMDAKKCYIGWRLLLKTDAPEEEIREVFDFVEDMCELEIELQNAPPGDLPERRQPATEPEQYERQDRRKEDRDVKEAASGGSRSIRVELDRIDQLVNLVGEMVIAQSMLQEQVRWLPQDVGGTLGEDVESLSRHMRDLQESVMYVRAQPIKSVFTRIPRIIREVAAACHKDVRLSTFGEDTEVDKTVLENLIDPLTHMIRNSVDHGIETPEERKAAGKTPYGQIQLSARHKSGRIIIDVQDDGRGINRDAVLKKCINQGLVTEDAQLTPAEIDNLIFKPGFSTAENVSEVSGRGVGMDVVRRNVKNLGGRITVNSTPGKGCTMTLSLPLTLAVMDGMVVSVGSQRFVLPTINIVESFQPSVQSIGKLADGVNVIRARGEYVRIIPLYDLFRIDDAIFNPEEALVILLESDDGDRISVMVDDVLGQQQVVIKSLETNFNSVSGISAATILGNGDVALILDVPGLTDMKANIDLNMDSEAVTELEDIKSMEEELAETAPQSEVSPDRQAEIETLEAEIEALKRARAEELGQAEQDDEEQDHEKNGEDELTQGGMKHE